MSRIRIKRPAKPSTFRHEQKYIISEGAYRLLSAKFSCVLDRDAHADESGNYFIRSLYFDDYQNNAVRDKIDGVEGRSKYRIRIYDFSGNNARIEIKQKVDQYITKRSLWVSKEQVDMLSEGNYSFLADINTSVEWELYAAFSTKAMRPCVIVDYIREAYVYPMENVRITFDKQLQTGLYTTNIWDSQMPTICAPIDGFAIMEIKFDEFLPVHIQSILNCGVDVTRSSVSKYLYCRSYESVV